MEVVKKPVLITMFLLIIFSLSTFAQNEAEKKILTIDDYPCWKRIISTSISNDGHWITYAYRANGGDDTLYVKNLTKEKIYEFPGGTNPAFSEDSKWAAFRFNIPQKEAEKLRKNKKPVPIKIGLLNLSSGEVDTIKNTSSLIFSKNSKYFAAKTRKSDSKAKFNGTDLILVNLQTKSFQNVGNVGSFQFNKPATYLAYTVDANQKYGNGIYLLDLQNNILHAMDTGNADYSQLTWDEDGKVLALLKGVKPEKQTHKENVMLVFTGFENDNIKKIFYNPKDDKNFMENFVLSEKGRLSWNTEKTMVFCGIKEQEPEVKKSKDPIANVDVWHWKDPQIQSVQIRRANRNRNFTYRSVFHLKSKKFVRLTDEEMRNIEISRNGKWGVGRDNREYESDLDWGGGKADYYRVNTSTGKRELFIKALGRSMRLSPDSRYYLYLKDKELWIYNLETGESVHISKNAPVNFVNVDDDHPYEKPAWGLAGWTKDGKGVIVNHKFDLWYLSFDDSKTENITKGIGEQEQIRFRYTRLDREERFIDTSKPLLLSAYGQWTKKSGYYSLKIGDEPKKLIFEDKSIGRVIKANNANKYFFTMQTFVDFPNYHISDLKFKNSQIVTDANPQQSEYFWGKRILIDYKNSNGVKLQATLTLPGGYEKGNKYPMLVYFYEKMSQRHHQYSMPTYDDRPHMSTYASDGYLVLMPDIVYTTGTPGSNAMDCVGAAVKKVIELGYADPDRIALQGHSWGGYQSSFLVTQTDLFCCVVTGAPPTNLVSFYNTLYKSSGRNQHGIMEKGQVRMGVSPWEDLELWQSQSPVHQAENIKTPFMILHGTDDGSVDWIEGLGYYNAARRLGKEVILLSYPGEGHHLSKKENRIDFQIRMKEYFDHYCKDKPAPNWLVNGVPFLKKKK